MSRVVDRADYFSSQVVRVRRFYDADWRARDRKSLWTCLVGGGCEWCAPDYVIARQSFAFLEFGFVARGRGSVELAGRRFDVEGGHAFFFDQRTPHVMRSHPTDPMVKYFFNFTGARGRRLVESSGLAFGAVVLVTDAPRMTELLEEIIDLALEGGQPALDAAAAALEHAVVCCAARSRVPQARFDPAHATYLRCRAHLLRHYPALACVSEAAHQCGISAAYMTRLFKRYDKETPLHCLHRLKLSQAVVQLRQPDAQVKSVAAELGYKSPAHFSRAFKAWHGRPPRAAMAD